MKPSQTMLFLYHASSPRWCELYPAHFENYKKILALLEAAEKTKFERIYADYDTDPHGVDMGHYGCVPAVSEPYIDCEDDQPLRRAALALKEKP
jgi:hypothetical protein